jgi:hypothetical protein
MKCSIPFCLIFLALIACCGCNPKLESEITGTQKAMDSAQGFHAEELAPSDWQEAMLTWQKAQAAIKEGRSARDYLRKAKSQFKKTAEIAEAKGKAMDKEISDMQKEINERYIKINAALGKGKPNSKIQKELDPLLFEVRRNSSSIENLMVQFDYVKAKAIAQDTLKRAESAELIMAGNKPVK